MLGNIGPMQLLIIFLIVLLIFGTKKLRNVGGDLGSAIRDFRKGMSSEEDSGEHEDASTNRSDDQSDDKSRDQSDAGSTAESTSGKSTEAGSDKPKS
ncbi:MAG: twin-arginine translocase TatA/TatE family subunit [Wenzhouxiangellaceae bacterium]|jgi:sec-independent protein translocase protein TatA|nr:twin-arginine translocase TatA/TatE family subunit [Wenzhouxiangellaceae bacterium]MBS3822555.1 twin-arginine translocase TatA/TatE family subunit [Wenzhouxiangellaceae bacterium]